MLRVELGLELVPGGEKFVRLFVTICAKEVEVVAVELGPFEDV